VKRLFVILVILAVIAAGVVEWGMAAWDGPGLPAADGKQTIILIAPGSRTHAVAQMLERQGLMKSGLMFEANLRARRLADKIKAGEYAIPSGASMARLAGILVEGKSIQHKFTAAEGLTSDMIWKLAEADPVLTGDPGTVPAEGSLLPETYLFTRGEGRSHLLDKMSAAQKSFLDQQWSHRAEGLPLRNMRQAVILASIVEKETALPQERRHIAAVFINRLKIGMRLQTDPTVIYGLTKGYPLGRGIRQSELEGATPYNTYVIAGLPPGPICNPGKDAIAAVLNPLPSGDLYFVATGHGGHAFASSSAEQARNVAAYRAFERRSQAASQGRPVEVSGWPENTTVTVLDPSPPKLPAAGRRKSPARHR
jgi:UPF0755 protein